MNLEKEKNGTGGAAFFVARSAIYFLISNFYPLYEITTRRSFPSPIDSV